MTKRQKVEQLLVDHKTLTPLEALSLAGTMRLGGIIYDLRCEGWNIRTEMVPTADGHGQYARYHFVSKPVREGVAA